MQIMNLSSFATRAPAKRGHILAGTLCPTMLSVCGKTCRADTRNVPEDFQKHFLCPPHMLQASRNESTFRKHDPVSNGCRDSHYFRLCKRLYWLWLIFDPFTPKSDKFQICRLTRNVTSNNMENLAFHSLLRWKKVMLPILTTRDIHFLLKRSWECTFWTWEWKG